MATMNSTQLLADYKANVANLKAKERACTNHAAMQLLADSFVKESTKNKTNLLEDKNFLLKTGEALSLSQVNLMGKWNFPSFVSTPNPQRDEHSTSTSSLRSLSPTPTTDPKIVRKHRQSLSFLTPDLDERDPVINKSNSTRPTIHRRKSLSWKAMTQAEHDEAKQFVNVAAICYERRGSDPLLDGMRMSFPPRTRRASIGDPILVDQALKPHHDRRQKKRRSQTMPLVSNFVQDSLNPSRMIGTITSRDSMIQEYQIKQEFSSYKKEGEDDEDDASIVWQPWPRRTSRSLDLLETAKKEKKMSTGEELLVDFTDRLSIDIQRSMSPIPNERK